MARQWHRAAAAGQRVCAVTWKGSEKAVKAHRRGKTCTKHGPSGHKTPLWPFTALHRFATALVTANTLPCSGSPLSAPGRVAIPHLEGLEGVTKPARSTVRQDTRPLSGPLPLCHCLPRSPRTRCPAAAVLCQRLAMSPYLEGFTTCAKHGSSRHKTRCGPSPLCHCLPRSPHTRCPAAAALCHCLAMSPSFIYRLATAYPVHRQRLAFTTLPLPPG